MERVFRRCLILGVSGSCGSYFSEYLLKNHPEVEVHGILRWHSTAHMRNLRKVIDKIHLHDCDLNDFSRLLTVIQQVKPDVIFHLASHTNVQVSLYNPIAVLNNNVNITINLYEAIRKAKIDPVIMLASSAECYGMVDPKDTPTKEDFRMNPANPYAVSKCTQDLLTSQYFMSYGMNLITTRAFTYINPRREDLFATSFARQIALIEAGKQKELKYGRLKSTRTITDVRDIMEGYWQVVLKGKFGEVYNIGGLKTAKIGEVLDELKRQAKCEIPSRADPSLLRPSDVVIQVPDLTKIMADTGWKPKYSFEESIKFLLDYKREEVANGYIQAGEF